MTAADHEHQTNEETHHQKAQSMHDLTFTHTDTHTHAHSEFQKGEERKQIPREGERKIIQKKK